MHLTRRLALAGAVASLTAVLAACGGTVENGGGGATAGSPGDKRFSIVGIAGVASDPFWVSIECGARMEAKKLGVDWSWKAGQTPDATVEAQNLRTATLQNPDAVMIAPFSASTFVPPIRDLMQKGKPVNLMGGAGLDEPVYHQSFRTAPAAGFEPLAELIAKHATSGKLAVLGGIAGTGLDKPRADPVLAALRKNAPDLKPLKTEYPQIDSTKAATIVSSLILAHPDLKAVYATSGPEAQGAAAAVQQRHKQDTIKVYAYDATPSEVTALRNGAVEGLIAQSPVEQGRQALASLVTYLRSGKSGPVPAGEPQDVDVPSMVLTRENVDSPEAKPFKYLGRCTA
jgi:ribose transport system substrate-binding protein